MKTILVSLALFCCLLPVQGDSNLFKDGKSRYVIVRPDQPEGTEGYAVEEFSRHFAKLTGLTLPVLPESQYRPELGHRISIGHTALGTAKVSPEKLSGFGEEGYIISAEGADLVIIGGQRRGTLYGVYDYLEQLGVRWFTPSFTKIPNLKKISLPTQKTEFVPKVFYRDMLWNNNHPGANTEDEYRTWVARMRLNGEYARLPDRLGGSARTLLDCHSYHLLVDYGEFAAHPEWFAVKEAGQRDPGSPTSVQLCTTNPQLRAYVVERVRALLRQSPGLEYLWVSQDDGRMSGCFCSACATERLAHSGVGAASRPSGQGGGKDPIDPVNSGGDPNGPVWSANTISLANFVADAVQAEFPSVKIKVLAYSYTWLAPKNVRLSPNVVVVLCGPTDDWFNGYPGTPLASSIQWWQALKDWGGLGGNVQLYTYGASNFAYWWPFPTWFATCEILQSANRENCNALYVQGALCGYGSEFIDLRAYLCAKTLFRPEDDFKKAFYEFTAAYYGPAAKDVQNYILWFDNYVKANKIAGHHEWGNENGWRKWMTPAMIAKSEELLLPALEAAKGKGADYEKRALAAYLPTLCVKMLAQALPTPEITATEICFVAPEKRAAVQKMSLLFNRGMQLNGYSRWNEMMDYDPYASLIARLGQDNRLYTLKNPKVKFTVAPSLGGRLLTFQSVGQKINLFRNPGRNLMAGYEEYSDGNQNDASSSIGYEVVSASNTRVTLKTVLPDGLEGLREYRVSPTAPKIEISSTYKNVSGQAKSVALRSHPEFAYPIFRDYVVYQEKHGRWEIAPTGAATSDCSEQRLAPTPSRVSGGTGRWLLGNRKENRGLLHVYKVAEVEKLYWFKGASFDSVTLELFGPRQTLQPGASATLSQSFELVSDLAKFLKP
ncbi:MAG: DUF4838 domain-containing protein [bacterium]